MMRPLHLVSVFLLLTAGLGTTSAGGEPIAASAQQSSQTHELDAMLKTIRLPQGFRIELFALVPGARTLALAPGGKALFVGTTEQDAYVVDLTGPGERADRVAAFAPSIGKEMPHGLCFAPDGTLFMAEQNRILAFPDAVAHALEPNPPHRIVVAQGALIPSRFESTGHSARVCRVGPDGRLYVTIGQPTNVPSPAQWQAFSTAGLGAILSFEQDGSDRRIFASGIRNSVGLDFNPNDATLWFTDNQVDMMGDDIPPGELNRAAQAGQTFGFPWFGGGHTRTHEYADSTPPADSVFPQVEMVAHAADLGMTFYRGNALPTAYRGGIFSAQHGSWNRTVPVGARIMFTPVKPDGTAGKTEIFAQGWLTDQGSYKGRPVDVAELGDGSLLITDDDNGAIYRISWAGPPP